MLASGPLWVTAFRTGDPAFSFNEFEIVLTIFFQMGGISRISPWMGTDVSVGVPLEACNFSFIEHDILQVE